MTFFCHDCSMRCGNAGQASLEAALIIPIMFVGILVLVQPCIILYDRMIMNAAAAEGCRLLITKTSSLDATDDIYQLVVARHLRAIPSIDIFHVQEEERAWNVSIEGDETSEEVVVTVHNRCRPLPLIAMGTSWLSATDADGCFSWETTVRMKTQPSWVGNNTSNTIDPYSWVHARPS